MGAPGKSRLHRFRPGSLFLRTYYERKMKFYSVLRPQRAKAICRSPSGKNRLLNFPILLHHTIGNDFCHNPSRRRDGLKLVHCRSLIFQAPPYTLYHLRRSANTRHAAGRKRLKHGLLSYGAAAHCVPGSGADWNWNCKKHEPGDCGYCLTEVTWAAQARLRIHCLSSRTNAIRREIRHSLGIVTAVPVVMQPGPGVSNEPLREHSARGRRLKQKDSFKNLAGAHQEKLGCRPAQLSLLRP